MRAIVVGLVFASAVIAAPVAVASHAPTSTAATAAFVHVLRARYGAVHGFWACPDAQAVAGAKIDCLAEFHAGREWHQTSAFASLQSGHVVISQVVDLAWVRHWSPLARQFILRSHEPQVPGLISVNSPAYDWGFLLTDCNSTFRPGRTTRCDAYDGNDTGLTQLFIFTCSESASIVTCINPLGDSLRYQPHPK